VAIIVGRTKEKAINMGCERKKIGTHASVYDQFFQERYSRVATKL